jgi:Tol biopolymer transport system component
VFSVARLGIRQAPFTPALLNFETAELLTPFADELAAPFFGTPVWSPNGRWLLAEGGGQLVVLNGETLAVGRSIEFPRKAEPPTLRLVAAMAWLRDSRGIIAVTDDNEVWRGDRVSGEVELVMLLPGEVNSVRGLSLSPDGERLAWTDLTAVGNGHPLMVTSLGSGETVAVAAAMGEDYCDVRWSPDGRYLSMTVHSGGPRTFTDVMVVVVDVATGEQTVVGAGSGAEWRP